MKKNRKNRLYLIVGMLLGITIVTSLILYALRQNISLYYTPQQVSQHHVKSGRIFRLGGMVLKGSVHHAPNNLKVRFILTDYHKQLTVTYNGILPSLFREGQGIVAQGKLNANGVFIANQVLAKHSADYRPPNIPSNKHNG